MSKSLAFLSRFWREEGGGGAVAAEYALLLAVLVVLLAIAIGTLGEAFSNAMDNAQDCVGEDGNCPP